jgi:polyisoprenoid-binding protein YceI
VLFRRLTVRTISTVVVFLLAPVLLAADRQSAATAKVIDPTEAIKLAKRLKVTVQFEIKSVGVSKDKEHWWLNSEPDWKDAKDFSVFVPKSTVEMYKAKKIIDPLKEFKDKTVQVSGYLEVRKVTTQLTLHDIADLKIIDK